MVTNPDALICTCGHPKPTYLFGERACEGEVEVESSMKIEPCSCPRFKLWYNDDELTESEREYIDGK